MLSVFDTLKETFSLWVRNLRYLCVLVFFIGTPDIFFRHLQYDNPFSHSGWLVLFAIISPFAQLVLGAVSTAAILGLLRKGPSESAWISAQRCIETYTWTLLWLSFLLGCIAIPFIGIFVIIIHFLGLGKIATLIGLGFFLVFMKYALADPLVVVENLKAIDALQRSWRMTRGHFLYVLGCYLILGLVTYLINWMMALPLSPSADGMTWEGVPMEVVAKLIDSNWIILSWSMYLRIKEADAPPIEIVATIAN